MIPSETGPTVTRGSSTTSRKPYQLRLLIPFQRAGYLVLLGVPIVELLSRQRR